MNIEEAINVLTEKEVIDLSNHFNNARFFEAIYTLLTAYEKEKEKNKQAYRKANNYLYFNDSADYEVALWEVIRTLRPDLAEKWDNGEYAELKYIEEE